jgi:hypothetical protein
MDIPVVALAFVTAVYTVIVLAIYDPLTSLWDRYTYCMSPRNFLGGKQLRVR